MNAMAGGLTRSRKSLRGVNKHCLANEHFQILSVDLPFTHYRGGARSLIYVLARLPEPFKVISADACSAQTSIQP